MILRVFAFVWVCYVYMFGCAICLCTVYKVSFNVFTLTHNAILLFWHLNFVLEISVEKEKNFVCVSLSSVRSSIWLHRLNQYWFANTLCSSVANKNWPINIGREEKKFIYTHRRRPDLIRRFKIDFISAHFYCVWILSFRFSLVIIYFCWLIWRDKNQAFEVFWTSWLKEKIWKPNGKSEKWIF